MNNPVNRRGILPLPWRAKAVLRAALSLVLLTGTAMHEAKAEYRYTGCDISAMPLAEVIGATPAAPKPGSVFYEMNEARQMVRSVVGSDTRQVLREPTGVTTVAQSVLNCDLKDKTQAEPNLLAVSKTDGSVWVRGRIINYDRAAEAPRPQIMFDTRGKWVRLTQFKDVLQVVAGETWIAARHDDWTVSVWGFLAGTLFPIVDWDERKLAVERRRPSQVFGFPGYVDMVAFNDALYGLMADGQVTTWGGEHVCSLARSRDYISLNLVCPHILPVDGIVEKLWKVDAYPLAQCHARFKNGKEWRWPCDIAGDPAPEPGQLRTLIQR